MDTKKYMKYPKRQLLKLATDRKLVTWEDGNKMSRDHILELIAKA